MLFQKGSAFIDGALRRMDVRIRGDKITEIAEDLMPNDKEEVISIEGKWLLPGFFDVHTHGRAGADFSDAPSEELIRIRRSYAECGVTSLLATTMTMEEEYSRQMMRRIRTAIEAKAEGARIWGINMEGPFLGPDKKGCHDPQYLKKPDIAFFEELDGCAGGHILLVDVDPNLEGAMEFIRYFHGKKKISIAHTSATYVRANEAVDAGADHVTHLYNAMNGLHHREPGVIGMVHDRDVWAELICDGIHVHESVIRSAFAADARQLCIVSDSLSAAGLKDGVYSLGGLDVHVKGSRAALADGTLACSVSNVFEECRNVVSFGVPVEAAIAAATICPAKAMGLEDRIGAIAPGLLADLLVATPGLDLQEVYVGGCKIK